MNLLLTKWFSKKKKVTVEFCQNNLDRFLDAESLKLFEAFFNQEKAASKEFKCISQCEICLERPYAKVEGKIIEADNSSELINKLKLLIKGS